MTKFKQSTVFLVPNLLDDDAKGTIPPDTLQVMGQLRHFIVENEKNARRLIVRCGFKQNLDEITFHILPKREKHFDYFSFVMNITNEGDIGVISDAGCPGIADPGAEIVGAAHDLGLRVIPLVGPSSILLALIASGLNGQGFSFHGYLPIKQPLRIKKLKELERLVHSTGYTQIFMETPYRNNALIKDILSNCTTSLRLSIASKLTANNQSVKQKTIADWKKAKPDYHKIPAVFCLNK